MNKNEIVKYINNLKGYQGYIQYLSQSINKKKDIFIDSDIKVEDKEIYEAHFANDKKSVSIKLINGKYKISEFDLTKEEDIKCFEIDFKYKVKMAQIWEEEVDELCENMKVKRLKAVVFTGFEGESKC